MWFKCSLLKTVACILSLRVASALNIWMPFNLKLIYSLIMAWKLIWFSLLNTDLKICILLNDETVQKEIDWNQYMKDALKVMPPAYFYGYWQTNTTGKRARSQLQITPLPSQSHHHCLYIFASDEQDATCIKVCTSRGDLLSHTLLKCITHCQTVLVSMVWSL